MAAVHDPVEAQTPRRRGRRGINILVLANPDHSSSEEDTPANSATFYSSSASAYGTAPSRPPTIRAPSPPRRPSSPRRSQLAAAQAQTASPRTLASPSPTSYVSASGSSARSSNSPGPESTPPPPTPSQGLPPLDINFQAAAKPNHVTPNLPFEDSDNQPESSSVPTPVFPQHVRRTSDGGRAIQSPNARRPFSPPARNVLSPPRGMPERIIVAVTTDAENYVVVDITGHTEAQAIRERILSKLHIPDDAHSSFAIYRTELGGFAIGAALDDTQLLIDCQHFGDEKGSLKFLAQHADTPTSDVDVPIGPPTAPVPVPPLLPSLSTFSSGVMRMPSSSRRPGSASPASDRLAAESHSNGYEASVSAVSDFEPTDAEPTTSPHLQTRSPIQTLHRHPASRRGRQPSSSSPVVRRQVRRPGSGSGASDMSPVTLHSQGQSQSQSSSPDRVSSSSSLTATHPHERRGSVTPTPPSTRSPPVRDGNQFDDTVSSSVPASASTQPTPVPVSIPQGGHARRGSESVIVPDSALERDRALAAEERRRDEARERWAVKSRVEFEQKRQQWTIEHAPRTQPNTNANSNGMYAPNQVANVNAGYSNRGVPVPLAPNGTYPPVRTGSGHGRRPNEQLPGPDYRTYHQQTQPLPQPHAPVRQQQDYPRPIYQPQSQSQVRQTETTRQPSPGNQGSGQGGYMGPQQQLGYVGGQPQQTQPYPPQQPTYPPSSQPQNANSQYVPTHHSGSRTLPPGPPRGAMPPRPPGSEYAQSPPTNGPGGTWFAGMGYDPPGGPYGLAGGGGRPQSPQLRGGARSMGNLRENYAQAPPPPPLPWNGSSTNGGRGSSPGQVQSGLMSPGVGMQVTSPPVSASAQQTMSPSMQASFPPPMQSHSSPLQPHSSPLQQSMQPPLPPPSMQHYQQQQQQHYERPRMVPAPVEQRTLPGAGYADSQRLGSRFAVEGGFAAIPTQNGQVAIPRPGDGRHEAREREMQSRDRERRERDAREARERHERETRAHERHEPVPIPRAGRQQAGTSPIPSPGYTPSAPRNASEFSTSPRPQGPLANWNSQNMVAINRPAEASQYYNGLGGSTNNTILARRTISGDAVHQQQRPQTLYDPPSNPSSSLRPNIRPGPRPLTDYDKPSPSDLYRPPPLPQASQHSMSQPAGRYPTLFSTTQPLDERGDDPYGGIEEHSSSPLSLNTFLTAPPPYEQDSTSPSSIAGEVGQPSPMPLTPEPYHAELDESRATSPSASDASTVGYPSQRHDTDSDRDSVTAVSDTAEGTLKAGDYMAHMAAIVKMVNGEDILKGGNATPPPPTTQLAPPMSQQQAPTPQQQVPAPQQQAPPMSRSASQAQVPTPQVVPPTPANIIPRDFALQEEDDDDDNSGSDEESATLFWPVAQKVPTPATSVSSGGGNSGGLVRRSATRAGLRLRIDGTRPSSQADSSPASTQESSAGGTLLASTLPLEVRKKNAAAGSGSGSGSGGDAGANRPPLVAQQSSNRGSQSWDIRPQAEEVYEKLDEFFPNHDLDKPVIDAPSGGTSPVTGEAPPMMSTVTPAMAGPNGVRRHKKSIRVVAAERKKMMERINAARIQAPPAVDEASTYGDSDSTIMAGTIVPQSAILRKRSTKMWGGRAEEVTPGSALTSSLSPNVPETIPEGRQRPTFKWVKGQLIGRGSFGRVYHALNLTTGDMIAVKQVELPRTESDRNDSRQMSVVDALKSESDTLRDLDHPHIVQYLGFEQTADALSIFLEYVPGGSVGSVLRKHGKFEDGVVRSFSHQIVDGLAYLHASGILHRDLKGDNILVDPSGICKISDFGISKRSEHVYNNHEGTAMQGSVFWMAPEMLHSNKQGYNAKIDIWSVGCVVLEMQAGRRPWTEEDMFAVMYKVGGLRQAPPVPEDVVLTPLADDFRQKCFAVDPAERPTAAELLKHPWLKTPPGWVFKGFK